MAMRCEDIRSHWAPAGPPAALSDALAEQAAEHVDACPECARELGIGLGELLDRLPVADRPTPPAVRRLARRQAGMRRGAAAAAGLLVVGSTAWMLLWKAPSLPGKSPARGPVPAATRGDPAAEPPRIADLPAAERRRIESEGVLILYLQFCLSCLNRPTPEDRREFLVRTLLILREVRGTMRARTDPGGPAGGDPEAVTLEGLRRALELLRSSPLPSVSLLPERITGFTLEPGGSWRVSHVLGSTAYRLTLPALPAALSFTYLKTALGAEAAQMARIEETLWFDLDVDLPRRLAERDPSIAPEALREVGPLVTPRQLVIYRKILGRP